MALNVISGGFKLSPEDKLTVQKQRAITHQINRNFIQVGAIWLKSANKNPFDEDKWAETQHRDTDLQAWIDNPEMETHNVGFNLQLGWMDIDIDAEDPEFNECVIAALNALQVDTRFKFGRLSVGYPSHIMVQLGEEESANFDMLRKFEPKPFNIGGKRFHVQLRSYPTGISNSKNLARTAKQTVMPGSIYTSKSDSGRYDISVWYGQGGVAQNVSHVSSTTPRRVNFNEVVRAICFATFLYCVRSEWVEGSRQVTAAKLTGWLARVVKESAAMNNHESISTDVFCPVDSDDMAERLIRFVCKEMGDDESHMRLSTYQDAVEKLERNPDARVPGWPAVEQLLGGERMMALRAVFMPGSDVSLLTKLAERYVYDESDDNYIDRDRFYSNHNYVHDGGALERRHRGDTIRIGGKPREAFRVFESSDIRKRVGFRDLYPDITPGSIVRISGQQEILGDDDESDRTALTVFNTWRGWPVSVPDEFDPALAGELEQRLDKLLGYLTRDNENQIKWIKDWIAWTIQFPGQKQQIAWVVVGDQGVGKSWLGNIFFQRLMGNLWGTASPKVLEGDFNVGPFMEKMLVFIDEAKFHSEVGTDEIKKLIRSVEVPGMEKFKEARTYRLFSRLMFASNRLDMNIGQTNVRDRALFYTRTYDREHLHMTELEFREWAETLKPFFEEFTALMDSRTVREHYMKMFMDRKVNKHEVESIKFSSSSDAAIVMNNMGWPRRIAKHILEDGRIHEDLDITFPFTISDLNRRVADVTKELGMSNVQAARVLHEFQAADLIEPVVVGGQRKMRFKYRLGTILKVYGSTISVPLEERYVLDPDKDFGENDCDGSKRPLWKGSRPGIVQASQF